MIRILFGLLISVLFVHDDAATEICQETKELEATCGSYCFKAIKPVLDHTKYLQSQVNDFTHQTDKLVRQEDLRKLVDVQIEQKLENLKLQNEKFDKKLQELQVEVRNSIAEPPYQKIGSKFYYIEESNEVNWFEAANKCLAIGGHLVSIQNLNEFNAIKQKLNSGKDYWIGINDLAKEKEFVSVVTGGTTYFNWGGGEPSNSGNDEHCGELYFAIDHRMNDDNCKKNQLFICERRKLF